MDFQALYSSLGLSFLLNIWLAALIIVAVIHYVAWRANGKKGPYCFPGLGCAWQFYRHSERIYEYKAEHFARSGTMQLYVYGRQCTYVADPEIVEHMLKTKIAVYEKGESEQTRMKPLLGGGISNTDGRAWMDQRKSMAAALVSPKFRSFRTACYQQKAATFAQILADHQKRHLSIDIQALCVRLALDTSCLVACGRDAESLVPALPTSAMARALASVAAAQAERFHPHLIQQVNELLGLGSTFTLWKASRTIRAFVRQAVNERTKDVATPGEESPSDLIVSRGGGGGGDQGVSKTDQMEKLTDAAVNLIVASQGPVGCALAWIFYELSRNPDTDAKLYDEIRRVTRSSDLDNTSGVDVEKLAKRVRSETVSPLKMPFMHAVISESLRLHPPVPEVCRFAAKQDTLPDGTALPSNRVAICTFATCRSESAWGPDAADFRPERWISDGQFCEESPFKFPAFLGGPRMCLGRDIAYLQMKIVLTVVLSHFRVQLVPGQSTLHGISSILYFKDGLEVTVEER